MKRKICGAIMALCIMLLFGVVGRVENGASCVYMLWVVPITAALFLAGCAGRFFS